MLRWYKKKQSEQKKSFKLKTFLFFFGMTMKSYHKILLTSNYCLINNLQQEKPQKTYVILRIQFSLIVQKLNTKLNIQRSIKHP